MYYFYVGLPVANNFDMLKKVSLYSESVKGNQIHVKHSVGRGVPIFGLIYGPIARKLYRGLFPKPIFQNTSKA